MKNTKIPKLIFYKKSRLSCYGQLKVIRSQCEANLHHIKDTNTKKSLEPKKITTNRYIKEKQKTSN